METDMTVSDRRKRMDDLERRMLDQRERVEESRQDILEERSEKTWEDGVVVNDTLVRKPDLNREALCGQILMSGQDMTAVATQLAHVLAVSDRNFQLARARFRKGTLADHAEDYRVEKGWRIRPLVNEVLPMVTSVIFGDDDQNGEPDDDDGQKKRTRGGGSESSTSSPTNTDGPSGKSDESPSTG